MNYSSKNNPCGICGRTTDSKCRWTDSAIFCYYGESFHPPSSLRLGDSVQAFGRRWKLAKLNGGFSGGSYIFAPASDDEPVRRQTREEREQYRKQIDLSNHKAKNTLSRLRAKVHRCLALPAFEEMTVNEVRDANLLLQSTVDDCDFAVKFVMQNRRMIVNAKKLSDAFVIWSRSVKYQKRDLDVFVSTHLGILQ
jgi:hypothetical protein